MPALTTATATEPPSAPLATKDDYSRLTATEIKSKIAAGEVTVEAYANSLLKRIKQRDDQVQAWAYLDEDLVLKQAKALDQLAPSDRGPLHGVAIAVKDIIYTKDMPTQHNSPIYEGDWPQLDAASIIVLRNAGALILGKTTTTEFAATSKGPKTSNPHDPTRTPGGSSSGSGAAVGDFQAPIGLGTQTGGSTIRPGSFNGIYAMKPTWASISREGQKIYSLILDTLGLYARSAADLDLLCEVFEIKDDQESTFKSLSGARFAFCETMVWNENAGQGTKDAMKKAAEILKSHGATVEEIRLPAAFDDLPEWHRVVLQSDGRTAFLPEYRIGKEHMAESLTGHVENVNKFSRKAYLDAFDSIGALRPRFDQLASSYDAVIVPSVPDEAPVGLESTGKAVFCSMWTALHVPVVNIPGFQGSNGMPIGLSAIAPRYHDRHLLKVSAALGTVFEAEGGWKRKN